MNAQGHHRRFAPVFWGFGAFISVAAGYSLLVFLYVLNTWSEGRGMSAVYLALSFGCALILLRLPSGRRKRRGKLLCTAATVLAVAGSGVLLFAERLLDGGGVLLPPFAASVLYGILVGRLHGRAVSRLLSLPAVFAPFAASAVSALLITRDPWEVIEFWDGFILPIPAVCCAGASVLALLRRASPKDTAHGPP